ncbi:FHA domain-containing protein [Dactylosporangium cerinum]|uniref:FHA domain-containing protein n=1 Tax=Dactylosporangium cerinum TaxID=1434730 RepID=A0ABV9W9J1_9ACTN
MAACPKGHESETTDYCDVCGAAMTAAPSGQAPPAVQPASVRITVCPECATPMTGRFCEVDGFDALAAPPDAALEAVLASEPVRAATPSGAGTATSDAATSGRGLDATGSNSTATNGTAAAVGWHVVVSADRAHFDRVEAWNGPDPTISYPRFCPERRFALTGEQVLIGRRSRSRGSYPDIDLAGPPEDIAVSHLHALLVAQPGGGWAVVDLRSANCTFVNDAADPIQPELPVPLADGDHINVGSFTRITVHARPL